jgi:pantetheine-phosphate adenylyltransferase
MENLRIAIFPGSFDPFTRGHEDVVRRAVGLFDRVIIAIGYNSQKKRFFEVEMMKKAIATTFSDEPRVSVEI